MEKRLNDLEYSLKERDQVIDTLNKELSAKVEGFTEKEKPTATTQTGDPLNFTKKDVGEDGSMFEGIIGSIIKGLTGQLMGGQSLQNQDQNLLTVLAMDNLREDLKLAKVQRSLFSKEFYRGLGEVSKKRTIINHSGLND